MTAYIRGSIATFSQEFLDSQTGDPITQLDSNYPQVQVNDPDGAIAASGIGQPTNTPGLWQWDYTIPHTAVACAGWSVTWTMVDLQRNNHEVTSTFEVTQEVENRGELDRTASYLTMKGATERIIWKGTADPEDISVTVTQVDETVILEKDKTELEAYQADCYYHYYTETPVLDCEGPHLVTWRVRVNPVSSYEYETQIIIVPRQLFWFMLPELRFLIDKLNKKTTTPLSYLPVELYRSLDQGLDLLNAVHPLTSWSWDSIPSNMHAWWILCGGLWALNSRQLLEIEVSHQLSGQTVTLDYDHASALSEVMSRWQDMIQNMLVPAKTALFRQSAGPGHVAVRPYRLNWRHRVFRAGTSNQAINDFPALMSHLGLFY